MSTFRPPTDLYVSWDDGSEGIFRYLKNFPRGRNVYKLTDGSFTENQPGDMSTVEKIYHGGHIHEVTDAEITDLIDAGYEKYIVWTVDSFLIESEQFPDRIAVDVSNRTNLSPGRRVKLTSFLFPAVDGEYTVVLVTRANKSLVRIESYTGDSFEQVRIDGIQPVGYLEIVD